uniref:UPAR/Ly6 domain-containing protein n=1 Tax=Megaselia scalaris TaxID=36166 RepID=T1GBA5_MEGSC
MNQQSKQQQFYQLNSTYINSSDCQLDFRENIEFKMKLFGIIILIATLVSMTLSLECYSCWDKESCAQRTHTPCLPPHRACFSLDTEMYGNRIIQKGCAIDTTFCNNYPEGCSHCTTDKCNFI